VDSELSKDRTDDIGIEDLWLRSFFRQRLNRLLLLSAVGSHVLEKIVSYLCSGN